MASFCSHCRKEFSNKAAFNFHTKVFHKIGLITKNDTEANDVEPINKGPGPGRLGVVMFGPDRGNLYHLKKPFRCLLPFDKDGVLEHLKTGGRPWSTNPSLSENQSLNIFNEEMRPKKKRISLYAVLSQSSNGNSGSGFGNQGRLSPTRRLEPNTQQQLLQTQSTSEQSELLPEMPSSSSGSTSTSNTPSQDDSSQGGINYTCPVCGKKVFKSLSWFTNHLEVHEGKRPFLCPICDKGFKTEVKLMEHVPLHHGAQKLQEVSSGSTYHT